MSVTEGRLLAPPPPEFTLTARAFEEQFDYVYRAMRRFGVGEPDIEDLVQEVFLVMWRRWAEYEAHRPLRPWLAGIAFHIAQKHISRGRREVPRGEVDREDESPHPDERLASARSRDIALRALASLPPKQRVLLVMHDLDGIEMRQIAASLQVPLFTAYSRLRRARLGFTRAVEQQQRRATGSLAGARITPSAVLDSERAPVPAPPEARRRARRQLRAWMAAPTAAPLGSRGAPHPGPNPVWLPVSSPLLLSLAAGTVLLVGSLLVVLATIRPPVVARAGLAAAPAGAAPTRPVSPPGRRAPQLMASVLPPVRLGPLPAHAGAGRQPTLNSGLSGYWRFDDGYGSSSARDLSAAGRDCRLRRLDPNGAWVPGALSGAIALERGFVECPQPSQEVQSSTELSVSAWVKLETWGPAHVAVVSRPVQVDARGPQDYFNLGMLGGQLKVRSDFWNVRITARSRVPLGRWVHVAFTYHRDASLRLYLDGKEIGQRTSKRRKRHGLLGPVFIGAGIDARERPDPRQQLAGAVDEVAIYDRALTVEEVAALAAGDQPRLSR